MSSVIRPVGDQPPGVYWRRRFVVLLIVAVLVALVARACSGGEEPLADESQAPDASAAATSAATASAEPSATAAATPTTSPTPTASPSPGASPVACSDDEVEVLATVAETQYPVGGPVAIRFVVRTTNETPCLRDVGAAANTVNITGDGNRIWSSDDCTPGGTPDVRAISRNEPYAVTVTWIGDVSRPECPEPRPRAPAGSYSVSGVNGGVTGPSATFTLG